jgi:tetratricopeptide (TPR) repeat protein
MKRVLTVCLIFLLSVSVILVQPVVPVSAAFSSPYYTYTLDREGQLIRTSEAYTPADTILDTNGQSFTRLEHIYLDENDYLYITDSKMVNTADMIDPDTGLPVISDITGEVVQERFVGAVIVLDDQYQEVARLYDDRLGFPKSTFVTEDLIYVVDLTSAGIYVYDKEALLEGNDVVLVDSYFVPDHPVFEAVYDNEGQLEESGYPFRPEHIAVDALGNIYVQGQGSSNGLIMLDEEGDFLTFFAGNPLRVPLIDQIRGLFFTDEQEDKLQDISDNKIYYDVPSDLAIDEKGFIYTVTSSIPSAPIKKFNVSGQNFFQGSLFGSIDMTSITIGAYNNVIAVNDQGQIFEYDTNGHLLFLFGGKDFSFRRDGLLTTPVSVEVNSNDEIFVADQGNNLIQIYTPTPFTNTVHSAFEAYYDFGDYEQARSYWEYILEYNAMFDYAHIGLGDAMIRIKDYEGAYQEYQYANDYDGMSDAFWYLRQEWLQANLNTVFTVVVILLTLGITWKIMNRDKRFSERIIKRVDKVRGTSYFLDELAYIPTFLRHPLQGYHEIKREHRAHVGTAVVIYLLLLMMFTLHFMWTNERILQTENLNISYQLLILALTMILFVVSNYLVCTINDGEGTIKAVFIATAFALTPVIVIVPINILLSQIITLNELVFYQFGFGLMIVWALFLLFFMIKDIHNYAVVETFGIIFRSLFTMLIMGLFLYVVNAMSNQLITFVSEVVQEVILR